MMLTVCKPLNERVGAPSLKARTQNVKEPGNIVNIAAVLCGDLIDGNCIWYRSLDGFYYWSGGFTEVNFELPGSKLESFSPEDQVKVLKQLQSYTFNTFRKLSPGFLGCGFGFKNFDSTQGLAFIIYVDAKIPEGDPLLTFKVKPTIQYWGLTINTDVNILSKSVSQQTYVPPGPNGSAIEFLPALIGGGIQTMDARSTGTRSIGVTRVNQSNSNQKDHFLLTAYHVLLDNLISNGQLNYDGSGNIQCKFPLNTSLSLNDVEHTVSEGSYSPDFDYAAVALNQPMEIVNTLDNIEVTDFLQISEILGIKGNTAKTVGYISGLQTGKVLSVFNTTVPLAPHNQIFNNVIYTEQISVEGDSGAPVIDTVSQKLIGFVIAGDDKTVSYILPFYNLSDKKNFNLL